jgi:2,3-bisphosphoglycerate-dependent phosphoglycerate mutase
MSKTGELLLLRHGESIGNKENYYSGTLDVALTDKGRIEAKQAGKDLAAYLQAEGKRLDLVLTSDLQRAKETAAILLKTAGLDTKPPVQERAALQERSYGLLEGKNKQQTGALLKAAAQSLIVTPPPSGEADVTAYLKMLLQQHAAAGYLREDPQKEDVFLQRLAISLQQATPETGTLAQTAATLAQEWRRGYAIVPPEGESLEMVAQRTKHVYEADLKPALEEGKNILVVAHNNTLRALVCQIQGYTPTSIQQENGFNTATLEALYFDDTNKPAHDQRCNLAFYAQMADFSASRESS